MGVKIAENSGYGRITLAKLLGHLRIVNTHRRLVRKNCFKVGLYWQGLVHDLSKYLPGEFISGVKYFTLGKSPRDVEREIVGYSWGWLVHKGRNRHHNEFWTDYSSGQSGLVGVRMPIKYLVEMFCDRVAASEAYSNSIGKDFDVTKPREFYLMMKDKGMLVIHPETEQLLLYMFEYMEKFGKDKALRHIRVRILRKGYDMLRTLSIMGI